MHHKTDLLSIHKQTNSMQSRTKNITIFIHLIFYNREIVKKDHFMTVSLSYANTVLWCSRCKIHRFVAAPCKHAEIRMTGVISLFLNLILCLLAHFCEIFCCCLFLLSYCHTSDAYMAYSYRTLCLAVCSKYPSSNFFIPIRTSYYVFLLNFSR